MHKSVVNEGSRYKVINNFHADRPMLLKPAISGIVTIKGEIYYKGVSGKIYVPELFDKMFTPKHKEF